MIKHCLTSDLTSFFIFSLDGKSDFVTKSCEAKPVLISNKIVEIIINKIIKTGLLLKIGNELITEIPAGTKRKLILLVKAVPTDSTCPNLTMPVHRAMNNNTKPITEAGIGIGINDSIILEINKITASVKAC